MFGLEKKKTEITQNDFSDEINRFRTLLLAKRPFWGEVLSYIDIEESLHIETAATDGRKILYNPSFFGKLSQGQRNFVLMHELMHIMLKHCKRGQKRDKQIWNFASDYVVNDILQSSQEDLNYAGINIIMPKGALLLEDYKGQPAEELYADILKNPQDYDVKIIYIGEDIIESSMTDLEWECWEQRLTQVMNEAAKKWSEKGMYAIPPCFFSLTDTNRLPWKTLLKRYLTNIEQEAISYATPERKYIHSDLIIPGAGIDEKKNLGQIWAFVDNSGSIDRRSLNDFYTQLYRLSKSYRLTLNIAYWHVKVADVYKNICNLADLSKCVPTSSGGTDPTCIYEFLDDNKIEPDVMLILTDGEFYIPPTSLIGKRKNKTIIVLNNKNRRGIEAMGKVTYI